MLYTKDLKENVLQTYLGQFLNHKLASRPLKFNFTLRFWGITKNDFLLEKVAFFGANLS